jgi:hypothetical protein
VLGSESNGSEAEKGEGGKNAGIEAEPASDE